MKIQWKPTILAGLIGTIAFDLAGLLVTGAWWDIPALLGGKLGIGLAGGIAAHFANGVVLAVIYAAIAPSLWGSARARALTYITVQTVLGVWLFMLPLLGAGVAGLEASAWTPLITLARHWAYGLVLAALVPVPGLPAAVRSKRESSPRTAAKEAA